MHNKTIIFALCLLSYIPVAYSGVQAMGTRVIYSSASPEADLQVDNKDKRPALIQSWVDRGNPNIPPSKLKVPFVVTPPLARIEPGAGQTLRIFFTNSEELPKDKESLFWLNILEIPHKPAKNKVNILQIAVRSRFKIFYRPQNLTGTAAESPKKIQWRLKNIGGKYILEAKNPTAFFVSISSANLIDTKGNISIDELPATLRPKETFKLKAKKSIPKGAWTKVRYIAVGDNGNSIKGESYLDVQ